MFGQPNWFRPKAFGWGLTPITWQGWLYTIAWGAGLLLPFWGLVWKYHTQGESGLGVLAGLAWLGCGIGLLCYDVRSILHGMKPPVLTKAPAKDDVLYIGPETGATELATRKYDMRLR
jgi:hypothetical protein